MLEPHTPHETHYMLRAARDRDPAHMPSFDLGLQVAALAMRTAARANTAAPVLYIAESSGASDMLTHTVPVEPLH